MNHKKKTIKWINSLIYKAIIFYQVYASKIIHEFKFRGK